MTTTNTSTPMSALQLFILDNYKMSQICELFEDIEGVNYKLPPSIHPQSHLMRSLKAEKPEGTEKELVHILCITLVNILHEQFSEIDDIYNPDLHNPQENDMNRIERENANLTFKFRVININEEYGDETEEFLNDGIPSVDLPDEWRELKDGNILIVADYIERVVIGGNYTHVYTILMVDDKEYTQYLNTWTNADVDKSYTGRYLHRIADVLEERQQQLVDEYLEG